MKFGDNLKNLRKSKKLSQEELAEKVGVSRQSVSKWETGEAYPEMNNILMLCKIFHCNINELVNDSLMDVSSLDEEIKMNVVKFKEEKQRKVKGLSKAIYIASRVIQCLVGGAIILLILSMIAIPFLFNRVTIEKNQIKIFDSEYSYRVENHFFFFFYYKVDIPTSFDIEDYLLNHSKVYHILATEYVVLSLVVSLIFFFLLFHTIEKLFLNIHRLDTPFTLENVKYIKDMAKYMIISLILPTCGGFVFEKLLVMDLGVDFELFDIIQILFLWGISYVFEYGYELQQDTRAKMYGDENE